MSHSYPDAIFETGDSVNHYQDWLEVEPSADGGLWFDTDEGAGACALLPKEAVRALRDALTKYLEEQQ